MARQYSDDLAFRKGIYWCHRGGPLHPHVLELQNRLGGNFRLCPVDGFDELFADLDYALGRQQRPLGPPPVEANPDYDDLPLEIATLADLDLDLALSRCSSSSASRARQTLPPRRQVW